MGLVMRHYGLKNWCISVANLLIAEEITDREVVTVVTAFLQEKNMATQGTPYFS